MNEFFSISNEQIYKSEILINKSRFLGFAKYVESQEDAEKLISQLKSEYKDARHICFAYSLINTCKASDDGEPSGTAGQPILQVIKKQNLTNVIIVVVRYFGGIKLGAGGLLRAYTQTAIECLAHASKEKFILSNVYSLHLDYKQYQLFLNTIKSRQIEILETNFDNGADLIVIADKKENINNAVLIEEKFYSFSKDSKK